MAKAKDVGVFQKEDGYWGYRFSIVVDGKQIAKRKFTDEKGNKLRTKNEAGKAREAAMVAARIERTAKPTIVRRTYEEVFEEFRSKGRADRAYQTIRKQDSLWENHLRERFGKRFVDEISSAEINDYLAELYYDCGYSFMYAESFLKMFYGIGLYFGRFAQSTALAFLAWAFLPRRGFFIFNYDCWDCLRQNAIPAKYGDYGNKRKKASQSEIPFLGVLRSLNRLAAFLIV